MHTLGLVCTQTATTNACTDGLLCNACDAPIKRHTATHALTHTHTVLTAPFHKKHTGESVPRRPHAAPLRPVSLPHQPHAHSHTHPQWQGQCGTASHCLSLLSRVCNLQSADAQLQLITVCFTIHTLILPLSACFE